MVFPPHKHLGEEASVVLQGHIRDNASGRLLGPGDELLGFLTPIVKGVLTEASWTLIKKDGVMAEKYHRIKARSGSKHAIVAVAHNLLLRIRRILLDGVPYAVGVAG